MDEPNAVQHVTKPEQQAAVQEARVQSEKYNLAIHTNNYEAAKSALSALAKLLEDRAHNRAVSAEIGRSAPQAAITLNVSREELGWRHA
jgi:hypothetical protein